MQQSAVLHEGIRPVEIQDLPRLVLSDQALQALSAPGGMHQDDIFSLTFCKLI